MGMQQILDVSKRRSEEVANGEGSGDVKRDDILLNDDTICVALARVGWDNQKIVSGKMGTVRDADLGPPIHSLIIPGNMHFLELDMLKLFAINVDEISERCNYSRVAT